MSYKKQNFIDYPKANYTTLSADHLNYMEDAIEALDRALDARVITVDKYYKSSNRFDKNLIPFNNYFYSSNTIFSDLKFRMEGVYGGGGWLNIPVEPGKTYTMSINNPVTLTDMGNAVYGKFINLWFLSADGTVISTVPFSGGNSYYSKINAESVSSDPQKRTWYSTSKITCKAYGMGDNSFRGMKTNAVTFSVIDDSIKYMHVQIGAVEFGNYQISADFNTRGHLTEAEIVKLQDSFQINEGTELLPYEIGGDYTYTEEEVQSNISMFQKAFIVKETPSTNLLNPSYVMNHAYINNSRLNSTGTPFIQRDYARSALLKLPIESIGSYVLKSPIVKINGRNFGFFGGGVFTDEVGKFITGNYAYTPESGVSRDLDITKVTDFSGDLTNVLKFTVLDENIKYVYIPIADQDKSPYGLWTQYSVESGLTDEELENLVFKMQLNKGTRALEWQPWNEITTSTVITPEYIEGLDTFQADMEYKIDEAISNIKLEDLENSSRTVCIIKDNNIYIKAKDFKDDAHFVWQLSKVNQTGGNKYFNFEHAYTCSSALADENVDSLSHWKSCTDDIFPCNVNSTYIGANHGYNCVDRITVTSHGKQNVDIGSVWACNDKTYVLVHVYNANELGMVMFNDESMASGKMEYGNPSGTMTHVSGATNTSSLAIEARTTTQLWQCFNHYDIRLLIDGKDTNLNINDVYKGNKIEILTSYDIIYVPAMLQYLMDNVGNNDADSQHSDTLNESYLTIYIEYQFNRNGSVSTYSSYVLNKDLTNCKFGLVQSMAIGQHAYIPDTKWKNIYDQSGDNLVTLSFTKDNWLDQNKVPYRYYQYANTEYGKGMCLTYDRSIGYGDNAKRLPMIKNDVGMYYTTNKQYPQLVSGVDLPKNTFIDGMAARVPLYKYDPDFTSVCWYWSNKDIILMIDTHQAVNKDLILPDYLNNKRIEVLDSTPDTVKFNQTYIFNSKIRINCIGYGYLVLRLYN